MSAFNPDTLARLVAEIPGAHWVPSELPDGTIGRGAWVPYGPGFEIPLTFTYEGGGPFDWTMVLLVIDGRPRCVRLECSTTDPERTVTPEALHRFPLGQMIEEAALMASRRAEEIPRPFMRWESLDQVRAERAAVAQHHRKRPNGGKRKVITDEFLAEVAAVYREHVATGKPSKAVEEHFHYTPTSARRVVREARLRGLLGPARPGRGGEVTTQGGDDG